MAVNLSPIGGVAGQFFDNNGNPLSGGRILTYSAGTTTPQATYTSAGGGTPHSNPIILDAAGRVPGGEIWLTDGLQYKFIIQTSTNVLIGTYDNVIGINSNFINYTNAQEIQTATAGQTVFTLTTMQYQPGTNSLSVFVDGVNQYGPGSQYAYQETSSTVVTFASGLHVGAEVKFTTSSINASSYGDAEQINYTPPFTGGVATNVEAKLAQTVSVKDFGAVGDGVADDTAAIQAALNANLDVTGVSGTYGIASSITIPANYTLRDIKLVALTSNMNMVLVNSGAKLYNVTLVGTGSTGVERGIYPATDGASDVIIENITISNISVGIHAQYLSSVAPARWRITGTIFDIVGTIGASEGYGILCSPANQCYINVSFENIRRHAVYLSNGASQNNVYCSVDGCGNYAVQIFSTSAQPACEGNVVRGTFKNLTEDVSGQVGAVAIISKANDNDISIEMSGNNAAKGIWIEGANSAIGPYPSGNRIHDSSFYGVFTGAPISSVYAERTITVNNTVSASYPTQAIVYDGNSTITVISAGVIEGNSIDAKNVGAYGITTSYECPIYIANNEIVKTTSSRVVDFSTLKARSGFNKTFRGLGRVLSVPATSFADLTVTLPNVIENPRPFTTVNGGTVSSLAVLTSIATLPSGSPQTFIIRAYNGHSVQQDIDVFWAVYGD